MHHLVEHGVEIELQELNKMATVLVALVCPSQR